jgi:hypothetical protein
MDCWQRTVDSWSVCTHADPGHVHNLIKPRGRIVSRSWSCGLALDRKRRLACAMANSMQGDAPDDLIAAEPELVSAPPAHTFDAAIEAQMVAQRTRNASAIARAQQKVSRERRAPRRLPK